MGHRLTVVDRMSEPWCDGNVEDYLQLGLATQWCNFVNYGLHEKIANKR